MRRSLRRLVVRHFGEDAAIDGRLGGLCDDVEAMLGETDDDRAMLERSLDLVSHELLDRNQELHEALLGGEVGTWSLAPGNAAIVVQGFPHPVVDVRGRAVLPVAAFLAAIDDGDRRRLAAILANAATDQFDLRVWAAGGTRWIEIRGRRAPQGHLVGICLDVTRESDAAVRQERVARYHDELVALARTVADGWGDLRAVSRVVTTSVARAVAVDRVGLWLIDDDGTALTCIDRHSPAGHAAGRRIALADAPGFVAELHARRVVAARETAEHPAFDEIRAHLVPEIRSNMVAGILVRGELRGMVTLAHTGSTARIWTLDDQTFTASLADLIALALEGERRMSAEAALEAQRRFLRTVIDLDPNFIFAKDRDGRFTLVNQAVAECYGTTVEDLVGRSDADFNDNPDEVAGFRRDDLAVMDGRHERFVPEERITDAGGRTRWLQTVKRPIVGADGRADQVLGVATDITARKHAEDQRAHLELQLQHAQRLESLGLLAGGVAHDFNNLLTPIMAYAEMGLDLAAGNPTLIDGLREIIDAADRARDLTRQLLAFGRKQNLVVRAVDLNEAVIAARKMLARVMPENIEIVLHLAPVLPCVQADAAQVHQVLLNLAVNARDAMPAGGRLTFATRLVPGGDHGTVVLTVSDTGTGMTDEVRRQIFEPFFTTKEIGRGTGLGLATVYGIVQQHAGTIEVVSAPAQGATFVIRLPAIASESVAAPPPVAPVSRITRVATVLVVEDEPFVRRLVVEVLRRRGLEVLAAAGPVEAVAIMEDRSRRIDLLLTDVIMPGMNGHQLYRGLAERTPDLRVVFMSGYASDVLGANGVVDPELHLLAKPFSAAALVAAVDEALGGGPADSADLPPHVAARG